MPTKTKSDEDIKEVFITEDGYLHHDVDEGLYLEDGERNYSFTDDVFNAYDFTNYDEDEIPKYIEVTHEEEGQDIDNRKQMCEVLKGKFVKVKIKTLTTTEWEEME